MMNEEEAARLRCMNLLMLGDYKSLYLELEEVLIPAQEENEKVAGVAEIRSIYAQLLELTEDTVIAEVLQGIERSRRGMELIQKLRHIQKTINTMDKNLPDLRPDLRILRANTEYCFLEVAKSLLEIDLEELT